MKVFWGDLESDLELRHAPSNDADTDNGATVADVSVSEEAVTVPSCRFEQAC